MPHQVEPGYDFFGPLGMFCENFGSLTTDIYSLSTATAVWISPAHRIAYPSMGSPHPLWPFMHVEKRTVTVGNDGLCRTTCEYAGFQGVPEPVVEWSSGVSEEPIQTHPNFSSFAGTPSHPLNDAVFVDKDNNEVKVDGVPGTVWARFAGVGEFAGVTSYLTAHLVKRVTSISPDPINVSAGVGHLVGSMLKIGASSTKRGIVYQNVEEYRGPGRRGWNTAIYG